MGNAPHYQGKISFEVEPVWQLPLQNLVTDFTIDNFYSKKLTMAIYERNCGINVNCKEFVNSK